MREGVRELGEDQLVDLADCCARVALRRPWGLVEDVGMALTMWAGEVAKSMPRSCLESAGFATTDLSPRSSVPTSHPTARPWCADAASLCNRNL